MRFDFSTDNLDNDHLNLVVDRAIRQQLNQHPDKISLKMDLIATNNHVIKLDFRGLFEADDFNFTHDICGIQACLNRETGEMERCFLPRFGRVEEVPC
jgi:hypothetical protein